MGDWKSFKLNFGKYKGDTMYVVYVNDFSYIQWLDQQNISGEIREVVDAAITHKNKTDPYSR